MFSHSAEVTELFAALFSAQLEFPNIKKDAKNPHFSSRYATLDQAKEELEPILRKWDLGISQPAAGDGVGTGCTTILFHKTGQWIAETLLLPSNGPGKESPTNAQTGTAAVTYSRRTGYISILNVVADNDDDGNSAVRGTSKPAQKAAPTKTAAKPAPVTAGKGPEKASIPTSTGDPASTKPAPTAESPTPVQSDAAEPEGNPVRIATEAEVADFRKRYAKTITILSDNGLEPAKGLPQNKKFLNFMLSVTKAEKAEHQSFEAWTDFFKRVDAKLGSVEGTKQLVELVESANKK
jgi:hypothetical protein